MVVAALTTALVGPAAAREDLAIVAHAEWTGLERISLPVLRQLYLGQRTRLAGSRVFCLDLRSGSRPREAFTQTVVGRDSRSLDRYWLRQALTGGPPPPRELGSAAEVLAWVAHEPGTLGYVAWRELAAGVPSGVRVLPIDVWDRTLHPGESGYPVFVPTP